MKSKYPELDAKLLKLKTWTQSLYLHQTRQLIADYMHLILECYVLICLTDEYRLSLKIMLECSKRYSDALKVDEKGILFLLFKEMESDLINNDKNIFIMAAIYNIVVINQVFYPLDYHKRIEFLESYFKGKNDTNLFIEIYKKYLEFIHSLGQFSFNIKNEFLEFYEKLDEINRLIKDTSIYKWIQNQIKFNIKNYKNNLKENLIDTFKITLNLVIDANQIGLSESHTGLILCLMFPVLYHFVELNREKHNKNTILQFNRESIINQNFRFN